jgi:hypothetical protein
MTGWGVVAAGYLVGLAVWVAMVLVARRSKPR